MPSDLSSAITTHAPSKTPSHLPSIQPSIGPPSSHAPTETVALTTVPTGVSSIGPTMRPRVCCLRIDRVVCEALDRLFCHLWSRALDLPSSRYIANGNTNY